LLKRKATLFVQDLEVWKQFSNFVENTFFGSLDAVSKLCEKHLKGWTVSSLVQSVS